MHNTQLYRCMIVVYSVSYFLGPTETLWEASHREVTETHLEASCQDGRMRPSHCGSVVLHTLTPVVHSRDESTPEEWAGFTGKMTLGVLLRLIGKLLVGTSGTCWGNSPRSCSGGCCWNPWGKGGRSVPLDTLMLLATTGTGRD